MKGLDLQWRQELHDQLFHTDIYTLDRQRKLTHLVLHMAKYNGKLYRFGAAISGRVNRDESPGMQAVAIDSVIVLMSMANSLNLVIFGDDVNSDIGLRPIFDPTIIIKSTGTMCKGLEALDHMEQQDIRKMFHEQILTLCNHWAGLFVKCHLENPDQTSGDFVEAAHLRWEQVEAKNIHYREICKKHPLVAVGVRL